MTEKKYADLFLEKVDEVAKTIREGYTGLSELIKKKFFFVRDVYSDLVIPRIDNVKRSNVSTSTTTVNKIEFEMEVDGFMLYSTTDIYLDTGEAINPETRFYIPAGTIVSFKWRGKLWFTKAVNSDGIVYIWGGY